jgi:hypothetical protein
MTKEELQENLTWVDNEIKVLKASIEKANSVLVSNPNSVNIENVNVLLSQYNTVANLIQTSLKLTKAFRSF